MEKGTFSTTNGAPINTADGTTSPIYDAKVIELRLKKPHVAVTLEQYKALYRMWDEIENIAYDDEIPEMLRRPLIEMMDGFPLFYANYPREREYWR